MKHLELGAALSDRLRQIEQGIIESERLLEMFDRLSIALDELVDTSPEWNHLEHSFESGDLDDHMFSAEYAAEQEASHERYTTFSCLWVALKDDPEVLQLVRDLYGNENDWALDVVYGREPQPKPNVLIIDPVTV